MDKIYTPTKKGITLDRVSYTKVVMAGRRRYFFDILSTKAGEKYISITESRKIRDNAGDVKFDSQKIFIFKEDFEKFSEALTDVLCQLRDLVSSSDETLTVEPLLEYKVENFDFENL